MKEKIYYSTVYQYENLYQAHRKARKGKRNRDEVIQFELDLAIQLYKLQYELMYQIYRPMPYEKFIIHDPKERTIHALHYRDRVVQHSLCDNIIAPYMEKHLIYDNAASRLSKGTHFAMDRLSGFMRQFYREYGTDGYILKFDIHKYYDSIDKTILLELMEKCFGAEREVFELLRIFIDSYQKECGKGIPLGNQTSSWFALYYLDGLDRLIKEKMKIKYYTRYMDDGVILHHDREFLRKCLNELELYISKERKLSFNKKTQITPLSQGVDYLGFHFYLTDTGKVIRRLRTSNKKRMKRKLKRYRHAYREDKLTQEDIKRSLVSYRGHLSHGHTYRLKKTINRHLILTKGGQVTNENIERENKTIHSSTADACGMYDADRGHIICRDSTGTERE